MRLVEVLARLGELYRRYGDVDVLICQLEESDEVVEVKRIVYETYFEEDPAVLFVAEDPT